MTIQAMKFRYAAYIITDGCESLGDMGIPKNAHLRHDRFSGTIIPCQPRYACVRSPKFLRTFADIALGDSIV